MKARYGSAEWRFHLPESSARFERAASSATERTAVLAMEFGVCSKTVRAISGSDCARECGTGNLALQNSIPKWGPAMESRVSPRLTTEHSYSGPALGSGDSLRERSSHIRSPALSAT